MARAAGILLLIALLGAGCLSAGLGSAPEAAAQSADSHDPEPEEWEEHVASDARGDVLIEWTGSADLLYLTMGELFSITRMEGFLFLRTGYSMTEPGNETVHIPNIPLPVPGLPGPPPTTPEFTLVMVNVSFVVNGERVVRISMWSWDLGRNWDSDQGQFLADNARENGDREIIYVAPLRRFDLRAGDQISDYNVTSYRNGRLVDTMNGFDAAGDYLPAYPGVQPLLQDPGALLPSNVGGEPLPDVPPPSLPPGVPDPRDQVPNHPYPDVPGGLPLGLPKGAPDPKDLEDWDPDHDGPLPWDPAQIIDSATGFLADPEHGNAWNITHRIRESESRIIVRAHRQVIGASINQVGFANFTVDSLMRENTQTVGLFFNGPPNTRWLLRYGLDMPQGIKTLPPGGRVDISLIAAPESLFSLPQWNGIVMVISDWGGIEVEPVTFVSTSARMEDPRQLPGRDLILPERLEVVLVNDNDHFRVNEPRQIMVRVRDADTGQYVSQLTAVRAYIYPAVGIPNQQPYQMREKPWMDGVYQIPFTFDRPGVWIIDVHFFDYPPGRVDGFPSEEFILRVDIPGRAPPLMPTLAALMSVALVVGAVWARERLVKAR